MPVYTDEEIEKSFQDLDAHQAVNCIIYGHSTNRQDIRDFALQTIDFAPVRNVLDLGCGFGFSILGLEGKINPNTHVVGIDIQEVYRRPFLQACSQIGAIGEFHVSDVVELASYPPRSFDLILSCFSLYFFPQVVKDVARVLTDEGTFVAVTHSQDTLKELIRHIPSTLQSLGLRVPELLSIQKLLRTFSHEKGEVLLKPHFADVVTKPFFNKLRFCSRELSHMELYLRMKQHLFLKEICDVTPDSLGTALDEVMAALTAEAKEKGELEFNKNDAVFICRRPTVRDERPARPASPQYCMACGHRLVEKKIEGRKRDICAECGYIAYENPLPVAAAVVVNDAREVLLVRRARHPMKGMWCLPCGFVENDEHIEEAVLRELHEETNVTGSVKRLLDAATARNYFYGNMVMMSFEITDVQGTPDAGDDADEARFFPLENVPPLAFPSQEQALTRYGELYSDTWRIQDSSSFGPANHEDTFAHLSDAFVTAVQEQTSQITQVWVNEVATSTKTRHYGALSKEILESSSRTVLNHLGEWIRKPETSTEFESFCRELGRERRRDGIPLEEMLFSWRALGATIVAHGRSVIDGNSVLDLYAITEFQMRITGFFDRAIIHLVNGYTEESR